MIKRKPKPYFNHEIPFYYDWDGYRNRYFDYGISFKCHVRTQLRHKIYQRNWKLYPPKPRTQEEIEADRIAFQKLKDEGHWAATAFDSGIWERTRAQPIWDLLTGE